MSMNKKTRSLINTRYEAQKIYYQRREIKKKDQQITQLTNQLKEFKEEHKIMKQILIENGLWERLLNDDRFINYLRSDEE